MGTLAHEGCSVNGDPLSSLILFLFVSFVDFEVEFVWMERRGGQEGLRKNLLGEESREIGQRDL